MTRRVGAVVAALVLVAASVALWLVLRSGDEGDTRRTKAGGVEIAGQGSLRLETDPDGVASRAAASRIVPAKAPEEDAVAAAAEPDRWLRVKVVDSAGSPAAGVRAILASERDGWMRAVATSGATAADGITVVGIPPSARESAPGARWFVSVDAPFVDLPDTTVDLNEVTADPVVVSMGPAGRVRLKLVDHDKQPVTEPARVTLMDVKNEGSTPRFFLPEACSRAAAEGEVVYEHVGVGTLLRAYASATGRKYPTKLQADGPRYGGEEIVLTIEMDLRTPLVSGRAVDSEARPLAGVELRSAFLAEGNPKAGPPARTDASGRFVLEVDCEEVTAEGVVRSLEVKVQDSRGMTASQARVALPRPLPRGTTDVGDLMLAPPPLVAAGKVVDDAGRPVQGAEIRIDRVANGDFPGRTLRNADWFGVMGSTGTTDAEGRFEYRERLEPGALQISAWKRGHWSDNPLPIDVGTSGLVLRVHLGGTLEGSVDFGAKWASSSVSVSAALEDSDPAAVKVDGAGYALPPRDDGGFTFSGLRPGSYRVRVETIPERRALAEVRAIRVVAGETTRDPRLIKLVLREPEEPRDK